MSAKSVYLIYCDLFLDHYKVWCHRLTHYKSILMFGMSDCNLMCSVETQTQNWSNWGAFEASWERKCSFFLRKCRSTMRQSNYYFIELMSSIHFDSYDFAVASVQSSLIHKAHDKFERKVHLVLNKQKPLHWTNYAIQTCYNLQSFFNCYKNIWRSLYTARVRQ